MGRHCITVKTLHGYTVAELQQLIKNTTSEYTRSFLLAVTMRHAGINTTDIMKTLGKSRPTIVDYINKWNENPKTMMDNRGGNIPARLTDEMIDDIRTIVLKHTPADFHYNYSSWNCKLLCRYIEDHYGAKFSDEWIRKLLLNLGFTYKRGVYKPSKADPELQEQFKKNGSFFGYF